MAQNAKDHRVITFDNEARQALLRGAKIMADVVGKSYGPKGENVIFEKPYGNPLVTRDGVTIAKETYSKIRDENMAMNLLRLGAEATVKVVGDGTTQTVVLAYNLLKYAHQRIAAGDNPMEVKDVISRDAIHLLDNLKKLVVPVGKGQLEQVAAVSCGEVALGKLIAGAVEKVGAEGGIITQKAPISDVDRTYVDGYYQAIGFTAIENGKKETANPYIIVSAKPITTGPEIIKLVNRVVEAMKRDGKANAQGQPLEPFSIAFIGEFEGVGWDTIVANIQKGVFDGVVIKSPMQGGDMAAQYLEDIATYTGGKLITRSDRLDDIDASYIGRAEKITATNRESTIFGGESIPEDLEKRIADLRDRIAKEDIDAIAEKLKERLSKLEGKISIFRIGGATEIEREEREFRIDDAIQATKAAASGGVVAGAGSTLVELSKTIVDGNKDMWVISDIWKKALQDTYKRLLTNAALPAEVKLNEVLNAEYPQGYNLRKGDALVDVIKDGVLDPAKVVEQVIVNATSTACSLVICGAVVTLIDTEVK